MPCFFRVEGIADPDRGAHGFAYVGNINGRCLIAGSIHRKAWMGLKAGHGRTAVIQHHQGDIGPVMNGIDQCRQGGVEKGGIPDNGHNRLLHAKLRQLAETAGKA